MATLTRKRKITIGPADSGRRMSLADFDRAIAEPGYLYELGNGVIEVSEIPSIGHGMTVDALRGMIEAYRAKRPEVITYVGGGSEAKSLIESSQSERHPDLSIYCQLIPDVAQPWNLWVPEVVVEVVSESSRQRDYASKPDEYFEFGVKEYWIIDPAKNVVTIHHRIAGRFPKKAYKASQRYKTHVLPDFVLDIGKLLAAGKR